MPNVLPVDWSGVVLEPKLDRVQQPNVVVVEIANRIKQTKILNFYSVMMTIQIANTAEAKCRLS